MIPGSGRSLGEENGSPLQYSGLENSINRGAWLATVHGVAKSLTGLSMHALYMEIKLSSCLLLPNDPSVTTVYQT